MHSLRRGMRHLLDGIRLTWLAVSAEVILSGGNVDLAQFAKLLQEGV